MTLFPMMIFPFQMVVPGAVDVIFSSQSCSGLP